MNVVKILQTKLRCAEYGNSIGIDDQVFANMLYNIIMQKYSGDDTETHNVALNSCIDFEEEEKLAPEGGCPSSARLSSREQQKPLSENISSTTMAKTRVLGRAIGCGLESYVADSLSSITAQPAAGHPEEAEETKENATSYFDTLECLWVAVHSDLAFPQQMSCCFMTTSDHSELLQSFWGEVLGRPSNSLDLAPSEFHLFRLLKKHLVVSDSPMIHVSRDGVPYQEQGSLDHTFFKKTFRPLYGNDPTILLTCSLRNGS